MRLILGLEYMYREELDERLIAHLAKVKNLSLFKAMDIYYHSRMADLIGTGTYGIQYLDYKVLVEMMIDNEPNLFDEAKGALDGEVMG